MTGIPVIRKEPCRICGNPEGIRLGETDYWDLRRSDLIKCPSCKLVQLDPMPSQEGIATGCLAYYHFETEGTPQNEITRNHVRNFRRGMLFGHLLKRKGFHPEEILEFGPGPGYFAAGLQVLFPKSRVTAVDIVDEVLERNRIVHGFNTLKGSPENALPGWNSGFDLIIARDLLEHVTDIKKVVENISGLLKKGGLFHFLTPNGKEDLWQHYLTWKLYDKPSELLINHLNYFDGKGLKMLLEKNGLSPIQYYTYQLKTTFRGKGWRVSKRLAAPVSTGRKAQNYTGYQADGKSNEVDTDTEVIPEWLKRPRYLWLVVLNCWFKHSVFLRVPPSLNTGHEICGLFRKK
jgi:SAM-dependent methyltransferase